jgi:aquaporin Z
MPSLARRLVAEAFGTFALVFFGCASVVVNNFPGANAGLMGIALVHAIVLSVAATATMNISGGLLNPALAIGLFVTRRLDAVSTIGYVVVQVIAAVVGAWCVKLCFPQGVGSLVAWGTPVIGNSVTFAGAVGVEALLTFFLMSAVMGTAVSPDAPKVGGFGIGLTLLFCILVAGPLTGPSVNPARAFGPALVSGTWTGHLVYWIGPILGAIVAALLWDRVLMPRRVTA